MREKYLLKRVWVYGLSLIAVTLMCISPGLVGATVNEDESITAQVKSALASDPSLSKRPIQVNTFNKRVQLTGFVGSQNESVKAVELARNVEMVNSVQDNLMIMEGSGPYIIPPFADWQSANP